jgi:hypothetical protein
MTSIRVSGHCGGGFFLGHRSRKKFWRQRVSVVKELLCTFQFSTDKLFFQVNPPNKMLPNEVTDRDLSMFKLVCRLNFLNQFIMRRCLSSVRCVWGRETDLQLLWLGEWVVLLGDNISSMSN